MVEIRVQPNVFFCNYCDLLVAHYSYMFSVALDITVILTTPHLRIPVVLGGIVSVLCVLDSAIALNITGTGEITGSV